MRSTRARLAAHLNVESLCIQSQPDQRIEQNQTKAQIVRAQWGNSEASARDRHRISKVVPVDAAEEMRPAALAVLIQNLDRI